MIPIAYAAISPDTSYVPPVIYAIIKHIINPLIILLFVAAFVVFIWGIFQFLSNLEDDSKRTEGKQHMFWGLVGLFVMMAVFAIMNIVIGTFNITPLPAGLVL
jgi:preprotein translocase subunit SecE